MADEFSACLGWACLARISLDWRRLGWPGLASLNIRHNAVKCTTVITLKPECCQSVEQSTLLGGNVAKVQYSHQIKSCFGLVWARLGFPQTREKGVVFGDTGAEAMWVEGGRISIQVPVNT